MIYHTEVLKSNLCDCSDTYIWVSGDINTTAHNIPAPVPFKNCTPFAKCITEIDRTTTTDDAED